MLVLLSVLARVLATETIVFFCFTVFMLSGPFALSPPGIKLAEVGSRLAASSQDMLGRVASKKQPTAESKKTD